MNQIDHYQIVEKIGEGGMGEVYKGQDDMLERKVAIKLLKPELSNRDDVVQRFRSEAVALGRLNHGNIAAVYNFGRFQDQYYMALEFVDGETLDSIIRRKGALPWREAVRYAVFILEGLAHAHSFNIVHRDIKPSNIIVTPKNNLKILDFGIARILEKARLTRSGHLVGTLEYVSPEQIQGKETDARADIYSTGVVLYEMLTGHLPFEKNTEYDLIKSQIEEKPKSPRTLAGSIPSALDKLVLKALEKRPEKRFADADEFGRELNNVLYTSGEKGTSSPVVHKENLFFRFCADYPILVLFIVVLGLGSGYVFWKIKFPEQVPHEVVADLQKPPPAMNGDANSNTTDAADAAKSAMLRKNESEELENQRFLPPPIASEPGEKPDGSSTQPAETPTQTAKTEIPKTAPVKKRNPPATRKKAKKSLPSSDPNIDDWAKDFFRN